MLIFSLLFFIEEPFQVSSGQDWMDLPHCSAVGCWWDRRGQKDPPLTLVQSALCKKSHHTPVESFPMAATPYSLSFSLTCFAFSQYFG